MNDIWSGFHDTDKTWAANDEANVAELWLEFRQHTNRLATFFWGAAAGRKAGVR